MHTKSFLMGLSLAVAFVLGCAVAPMVSPPAAAGTGGPTWEYHCFQGIADDEVTEQANEAGRQGWEMSGSASDGPHASIWCFKRPL